MGAAVWPTVKILSNHVVKQFPLALPSSRHRRSPPRPAPLGGNGEGETAVRAALLLLSLSWGLSGYAASAASIASSFSFAPFAQPCHFGIRIDMPPV